MWYRSYMEPDATQVGIFQALFMALFWMAVLVGGGLVLLMWLRRRYASGREDFDRYESLLDAREETRSSLASQRRREVVRRRSDRRQLEKPFGFLDRRQRRDRRDPP